MKHHIKGEEITRERNLLQVYMLARKIKPSWFNKLTCVFFFSLLFCDFIFLSKDLKIYISEIRAWSSFGFSFTVTTLGFLITGFTIFATLSKPQMMIAMMLHTNEDTGIPTLKYNFMAFMKVFIAFIFCTFIYLVVILFGQEHGIVSRIIKICPYYSDEIRYYSVMTAYVLIGTSLFYLVLIIKTFIFNIYSIIMTSIRWEYEVAQRIEHEELESKSNDNTNLT